MRTTFGPNEIILLLGAGASVEAGIPDSKKMVQEIERLVASDAEWQGFQSLYRYIRSSVFYADGLDGKFGDDVPYNIERLVDVLEELNKRERHTLYPFVGTWNQKLVEVAGMDFERVKKFRGAIINILRNKWVDLQENERAAYYCGLLRLQSEYEYPLRVFSLNYDLCVEKTCGLGKVQRGFADKTWDWRLFDETSDDPLPIVLYKLHGSVDWYSSKEGRVRYFDSTSSIDEEDIALIFGTSYKLQYVDPFLFLVYELRRWTLDAARVIVSIGYGFNDEHINGILQQALRQNVERKLLAVVGPGEGDDETRAQNWITEQLGVRSEQIVARACGAREFLEGGLTIDALSELFPPGEHLILELDDAQVAHGEHNEGGLDNDGDSDG